MIRPNAGIDPAAMIGPGCEIHASAVISADVQLGRGVVVGAGSVILGPTRIGDGCRIAAGCVLDPAQDPADGWLILEPDVHLCAGTVVAARLTIASGARVQAGTVVQRPVPPHAIVSGNPAQITGYASSREAAQATPALAASPRVVGASDTGVRNVTFHHFPRILDLRGNLTVGEFGRSVPFEPKRYFIVFGVPNAEIRGEHAHRTCKQFLVCPRGSCSVVADDGEHREEFVLYDPAVGLYLPPLTWGIQYKYSPDAVLLVFASEHYDSAEYIRDYAEFKRLAAVQGD